MTQITPFLRLQKTLYMSMRSTVYYWDYSRVSSFKKNLQLSNVLDFLDLAVICVKWTQNQAILSRLHMFRHVG
jgi:hypothetical protein